MSKLYDFFKNVISDVISELWDLLSDIALWWAISIVPIIIINAIALVIGWLIYNLINII